MIKDYFGYWKEQITGKEALKYEWFCRDEEAKEHSAYMFCTETNNDGPCCMSAGAWRWSADINKLASWIIEVQLRNIFSRSDERKDIKDTLDRTGTEYLRFIADSRKGKRGEKVREEICLLAEELQRYINAGSLTFEVFNEWTTRCTGISEDMPVIVEFELFNGSDVAMELLREHEKNQFEDRENLNLCERFQADCTY